MFESLFRAIVDVVIRSLRSWVAPLLVGGAAALVAHLATSPPASQEEGRAVAQPMSPGAVWEAGLRATLRELRASDEAIVAQQDELAGFYWLRRSFDENPALRAGMYGELDGLEAWIGVLEQYKLARRRLEDPLFLRLRGMSEADVRFLIRFFEWYVEMALEGLRVPEGTRVIRLRPSPEPFEAEGLERFAGLDFDTFLGEMD